MLVKKLKCPNCSAVKINKITTGFIYCDYCGTYMGIDLNNMQKDAFDAYHNNSPEYQEYTQVLGRLGQALKNKDAENYKKEVIRMHELEFDVYPNRFGPKAKQPSFRQKYMTYHKHYYEETINDEYFVEYEQFIESLTELGNNLTSKIIDNQVFYEFDDNFKQYFETTLDYYKEKMSAEKLANSNYMKYYPEYYSSSTPDILLRHTINTLLSGYHTDLQAQIINYYGYNDEYIEIPDVLMGNSKCKICDNEIVFPEDAKSIVCENCGTLNNLKTDDIECLNCSASFKPDSSEVKCPYCGALTQNRERININKIAMEKMKIKYNSQNKKSFWKRLLS